MCRFPYEFSVMSAACRFLFFLITFMIPIHSATAGNIHVAVASNFIGPMEAIVADFETRYSHKVTVSSGSSGKLYAQIRHGAPYELLFSADQEKPALLEAEGLAVPGTRFTYAAGKLVLWSSRPGMIKASTSLDQLLAQPQVQRIALANPRLAPYGAAAVDVLDALGMKTGTRAKWVLGENIAQTYQFVRSGSAQLGFVAMSQLISDHKNSPGAYLTIPDELYRPILQDAVLLKSAKDNPAAALFIAFVQGDAAARIIAAFGYETSPDSGVSP